MRTFPVDAVEPSRERLPAAPLSDRHPDALAFGRDPATPIVAHGAAHALLGAVGLAFAKHYPLVLSPDAVWLTIAQGVAQHVRIHAEELRGRLVRHDGRKRLELAWSGPLPTDAASWSRIVPAFRALLAGEIGDGRARVLECAFSTTTDVERLASQIVLFDAYSPYYSLWMTCVCGIPAITLTGSVDDWRTIRERIDVIAELDLARWCRSLAPIADHFVRAAEGNADAAFWRRIYSPVDAYGGEAITGWITRLYPYLKYDATQDVPNPMLDLPLDEPKNQARGAAPGLRSDSVPNTASRVTVHVVDTIAGELGGVTLVAGVDAVVQDAASGALTPIASWRLEPAVLEIGEVLDRIASAHGLPRRESAGDAMVEGPADVVAMMARLGATTLFPGAHAWKLLARHDSVAIDGVTRTSIHRVAELPGGRSLCYALAWAARGDVHWFACRVRDPARGQHEHRAVEPPAQIARFGTSLAALLDGALASNGELDHMAVGRLADVV